ncbi:Sec-independent protein translocase protein TatB [Linum grandiflorum]
MFGISYGELFILLGATAALIGPKDLPIIARTAGRLTGRAIAYVQLARGQFESVMQQSQARQIHKDLQEKMAQMESILYEIRSTSMLRPGPMTRKIMDDLDNSSKANGNEEADNSGVVNVSTATVSQVSTEQSHTASISTSTVSQIYTSKVSDSTNMHSQATAYARLAESAALKATMSQNGLDSRQQMDDLGLINILPVSAESTGMLPNRQGNANGSDILLEAIMEAEVAHNAKDFFAQPENQIKQEGEVEKR